MFIICPFLLTLFKIRSFVTFAVQGMLNILLHAHIPRLLTAWSDWALKSMSLHCITVRLLAQPIGSSYRIVKHLCTYSKNLQPKILFQSEPSERRIFTCRMQMMLPLHGLPVSCAWQSCTIQTNCIFCNSERKKGKNPMFLDGRYFKFWDVRVEDYTPSCWKKKWWTFTAARFEFMIFFAYAAMFHQSCRIRNMFKNSILQPVYPRKWPRKFWLQSSQYLFQRLLVPQLTSHQWQVWCWSDRSTRLMCVMNSGVRSSNLGEGWVSGFFLLCILCSNLDVIKSGPGGACVSFDNVLDFVSWRADYTVSFCP